MKERLWDYIQRSRVFICVLLCQLHICTLSACVTYTYQVFPGGTERSFEMLLKLKVISSIRSCVRILLVPSKTMIFVEINFIQNSEQKPVTTTIVLVLVVSTDCKVRW